MRRRKGVELPITSFERGDLTRFRDFSNTGDIETDWDVNSDPPVKTGQYSLKCTASVSDNGLIADVGFNDTLSRYPEPGDSVVFHAHTSGSGAYAGMWVGALWRVDFISNKQQGYRAELAIRDNDIILGKLKNDSVAASDTTAVSYPSDSWIRGEIVLNDGGPVEFHAYEPDGNDGWSLLGSTSLSDSEYLDRMGIGFSDRGDQDAIIDDVRIINRDGPGSSFNPDFQMTEGVWTWFPTPRALYDPEDEALYFGGVGQDKEVLAARRPDAGNGNATVLYREKNDDHLPPAFHIDNETNRVMAFWCRDSPMRYRRSTDPHSVESFEATQDLVPSTDSPDYPKPVQLPAEDNDIYLFYRSVDTERYVKSTDNGDTWSGQVTWFDSSRDDLLYTQLVQEGDDTIHFALTPRDGDNANHKDIMYVRYTDGTFYNADGSVVGTTADTPFDPVTDLEVVFDSSANGGISAWIHEIRLDDQNRPRIVFATYNGYDDHRYNYAAWDGSQWIVTEFVTGMTNLTGSTEQPGYSGGITIDADDPNRVYYCSDASTDTHELYTAVTDDLGQTWTHEQLTDNVSALRGGQTHLRPVSVGDGAPIDVLWNHGTYNSPSVDYNIQINGRSVQ